MNAWWKVGILLGLAVSCFAAGWHVKGKYVQADQLETLQKQVTAAQLAQHEANDHAIDLEKQLADQRQQARAINTRLEEALAKHPEFTSCRLPAGSVQLLNDAIAGRTASGFDPGM